MQIARAAGAEPLPGYRLLEPLGSGGFGEAWKCEVPGGFCKAIKFVNGNLQALDGGGAAAAKQELEALEHIKAIRHPFLLSTERVEIVDGELMIVMELADKNLQDLLTECQEAGLPGIPREDLLALLLEAAEALDWLNFQHGLQHLDIKPRNLFLVSGHVKVADFGLVNRVALNGQAAAAYHGGTTPLYAPPEILKGFLSRHCDQYSLAIVYQQLLTDTLPFAGKNARQLVVQHLSAAPDLTPLPAADQPVVAKALAKDPEERFKSCLDFLQALLCATAELNGTPPPAYRRTRLLRLTSEAPAKGEHAAAGKILPAKKPDRPPRVQKDGAPTITEIGSVRAEDPAAGTPTSSPNTDAAAPTPAPNEESVPGYALDECLGVGPLGTAWKVRSTEGREQLARFLPTVLGKEDKLQARLQALRHEALPATRVLRSASGRLVMVTDLFEHTLLDRFEECREQGLPGIPRHELLGYLDTAADVLDTLHEQHGLQHLGLNPRHLLLQDGRLLVGDFGLIELLWLPYGRSPVELAGRFAAPELAAKETSSRCDQYSLALIYAELLSGVYPRPTRGSGSSRGKTTRRPEKLELDLLPATDRSPLARALHHDPDERFASCSDFVQALQAAGPESTRNSPVRTATPSAIVSVASLRGEPADDLGALPSVRDLVSAWLPVAARIQPATPNLTLHFRAEDELEHQCLIRQLPAEMIRLKLHSFCQRWRASRVAREQTRLRFRVPAPASWWQRCLGGKPSGLEIELKLEPVPESSPAAAHARIRIYPFGGRGGRFSQLVAELGPHLVETLRHHLQLIPDRRAQERWPFPQPLRVYPLSADLELEGVSQDVSLGGIRFRVPQPPPTEQVYLHVAVGDPPDPFAVLARVVWVRPHADGWYDVGAAFYG